MRGMSLYENCVTMRGIRLHENYVTMRGMRLHENCVPILMEIHASHCDTILQVPYPLSMRIV